MSLTHVKEQNLELRIFRAHSVAIQLRYGCYNGYTLGRGKVGYFSTIRFWIMGG